MSISLFLLNIRSYYGQPDTPYPDAATTHIIGLCTGLLTGAAVSCCRSLTELIPVAVQTVLVAFRTGIVVTDVRGRIDMGEPDRSWSIMIPGLAGDAASPYLEEFSTELVCLSKMTPMMMLTLITGPRGGVETVHQRICGFRCNHQWSSCHPRPASSVEEAAKGKLRQASCERPVSCSSPSRQQLRFWNRKYGALQTRDHRILRSVSRSSE